MRNFFKKFGREGRNPGGLYQPPLGVFGWRNTLGICGLIYAYSPHYSKSFAQLEITFWDNPNLKIDITHLKYRWSSRKYNRYMFRVNLLNISRGEASGTGHFAELM